jgi:TP901 family phage tail tape measure protein
MPESVSLPLEGRLVNQSKLERQVANVAKKAGRNLKIDLGTNAKDIKSLEQPLGRITGQADEFGKSMQAANARVIAFGASVGLINAVVQSFKSLVTTTIEVEKSLAKINSILKTSTSGLNGLKNEIFEIAKGTEQTFGTVADAALELSRQGLSATEVTKRLNDAMILARLSGISAADAVSGLTAAVNSFTKAGLTTGEVLNKISNAANQFAVSERDLIEGFKRSASVAQQAGVSIDELGGIITAVQQKTARGGAVIGNSFKTIFTRIGRSENLDLLRSIGVQVTDLQGKILPATKLIEGLAKELENLNDVQVRNITEKIGGGFQIAPLIAALSDYSSETSIAIQATEAFRNASNQAYEKNIILNQTLSAAINTTSLSVQDLANRLGELGVTDTFKELLGIFNNFAQKARDVLDGEGIGGDLAKGITSGLGTALIKGGLAIFGLLLYKLSKQLLKFGVDSFKTFLGLNKEAQKLQSIQAQIVQTLIGDKSIREQILKIENSSLSAENKRAQQAEFFNKALRERVALTSQLNKVAVGVSPLIRAGATKRGADGFLPIGAEQKDIGRGVGGASSGAKPVVIPNFAFGNGKKGTMVANSSEYIVPNFAGGGSAIFNQDMVKSMGLPSGAKKINAAGGFIPNFANGKANASKASSVLPGLVNSSKSYILLTGDNSADESKTLYVGPTKKGKGLTAAYSSLDEAQTYLASGFISKVSVPKYSMQTSERKKGSGKSKSDIDYLETKVSDFSSNLARNYAKGLSSDGQIPKATKSKIASLFNKGALSGFAGTIFETGLSAVLNDDEFKDYSSRTDTSRIDLPSSPKLFEKFGVKDASIGSAGAEVKNRAGGDQVKSTAKKFYDILVGKQNAFAYKKDSPLAGKFIDKQSALAKYNISKDEYKKIEADYGVSPSSKRPLPTSLFSRYKLKTSAASGYIPNYAQGGALEEAIQREKEAGVPINQIRVNQDGKLRNSQNPNGIAVTNTRDEPTGAIPNFSRKSTRLGLGPNPVANSGPGTATVDSLNKLGDSAEKSALAQERSNNRMIALTGTAFLLQNVFSGVATETEGFGSKLASAAEGLSSAVFTQGLLGQVGGDLGSLKGSFSEDKSFKSRTAAIKEKAEKSLSALGGKSFKQTSILKFAPVLGKAASIFTKLVPILGTAVTAYQALNPLLKTFGIDILAPIKAIGVAFGIVDSPARKAAKSLEALNDAALQGFGGSAVNAAKRELATIRNPKDKEGKTIKDPVEAIKEALKQASIGTNSTAIEGKEKVRITTGGQSTSVGGFGTFYSRERQQTVTRATFEKDGERIGKQVFDILEETAEETATRMSQELLETLSSKQKAQVLASPTLAIDFVRKQQEVLGKEESKKLTSAQENISVARSKLSDKDLSPEQQKKYNKLLEEALKETERIYDILTKISDESEAQLKIDKERAKLNKELFEQRLTQVQQQKQILTGLKTEREFALEAAKSSFLTSKQRKVELDVELKKSEAIRKKRVDISKALFDSIRSNKTVNTLLAADANELFDEDNGKQYQSILDGIVGTFLKTGKISESQIKQELEKVDISKSKRI